MILENKKLCSDYHNIYDIIKKSSASDIKGYICAVNANILINCYLDERYNNIVNSALINICDGVNVSRINNLLGYKKIKNYPAPDFFIRIVKEKVFSYYFLGGTKEISISLFENMKKYDNRIKKENFYSPPFLSVNDFDYKVIAENINNISPDIIWVGLGAPKQEVFMYNLLPYINRGIMLGVGAVFNFYSGIDSLKRAPYFVRKYNFEWLYRAFQEPKRIIPRQLKSAYYLPQIFFSDLIERYR